MAGRDKWIVKMKKNLREQEAFVVSTRYNRDAYLVTNY